jgi:hypothetical protein
MATATIPTEAAIFERVIETDKGDLSPDLARYLLSLDFRPHDKQRMHDLAVRNQEGRLSAGERDELNRYVNVGHLLARLQSKARKSMKTANISR